MAGGTQCWHSSTLSLVSRPPASSYASGRTSAPSHLISPAAGLFDSVNSLHACTLLFQPFSDITRGLFNASSSNGFHLAYKPCLLARSRAQALSPLRLDSLHLGVAPSACVIRAKNLAVGTIIAVTQPTTVEHIRVVGTGKNRLDAKPVAQLRMHPVQQGVRPSVVRFYKPSCLSLGLFMCWWSIKVRERRGSACQVSSQDQPGRAATPALVCLLRPIALTWLTAPTVDAFPAGLALVLPVRHASSLRGRQADKSAVAHAVKVQASSVELQD